jgi:hypothetical protein
LPYVYPGPHPENNKGEKVELNIILLQLKSQEQFMSQNSKNKGYFKKNNKKYLMPILYVEEETGTGYRITETATFIGA